MTPASLLARLSVRVRVTLAVTLAMAVVFGGFSLFLVLRVRSQLDRTIDAGLRTRAADVTALIQHDDSGFTDARRSPLIQDGENVAQILSPAGAVVDAPPQLRGRSLLSAADLRRARGRAVLLSRSETPGGDPLRLLAVPVRAQERRLVVVVGQPLEARDEAIAQLGRQLLVGGPIALLLASLIGYLAAAGALRPVVSMARRAREIRAPAHGARLPVPPSNDEVAALGETLNGMLARLEEAFTRERRFVSDASHELRTPLAILKGELELALRTAATPADYRAAVVSAAEETDRVVQLAEDLLVIARSDQGGLPVRLGALPADEVLDAIHRRFAGRAAERDVVLDVDAPPGLMLCADPQRLEQALGNLVDNALRHCTGAVAVIATRDGPHAVLAVLDDGDGFPAEFVGRAFDRFTRADSARTGGGAGLGLAIVRTIAHAHHGTVRAGNGPGGGGWVELRVPLSSPLISLSQTVATVPPA